jgi:hypothetical protein
VAVMGGEQVADLQFARRRPPLPLHIKRMLRRRASVVLRTRVSIVQVEDPPQANKDFLNLLRRQGAVKIMLIPRENRERTRNTDLRSAGWALD